MDTLWDFIASVFSGLAANFLFSLLKGRLSCPKRGKKGK